MISRQSLNLLSFFLRLEPHPRFCSIPLRFGVFTHFTFASHTLHVSETSERQPSAVFDNLQNSAWHLLSGCLGPSTRLEITECPKLNPGTSSAPHYIRNPSLFKTQWACLKTVLQFGRFSLCSLKFCWYKLMDFYKYSCILSLLCFFFFSIFHFIFFVVSFIIYICWFDHLYK